MRGYSLILNYISRFYLIIYTRVFKVVKSYMATWLPNYQQRRRLSGYFVKTLPRLMRSAKLILLQDLFLRVQTVLYQIIICETSIDIHVLLLTRITYARIVM